MERIQLHDDLQFSRIIHGHWRLADWNYTGQQTLGLLEQCLELGITTIDTASIYGKYTCEELFGNALSLKPELRGKIEIVTKCGIKLANDENSFRLNHYDSSKEHIIESTERSLTKLRTDYIDVLLIHRPDVLTNPEEVAEAFSSLKKDGKVKHFGVSNFLPSQVNMLEAYLDVPLVTNQVELSVMYRDHFENGVVDQCIEKKMPPMAWSPLNRGAVFNNQEENPSRVRSTLQKVAEELGTSTIDEVMYAWLMHHPANIMPIAGSGKIERIQSAVNSISLQMNREQWYEIWVSSRGKDVD
ncbi:oxidoreductase [Peribacillus cavernae]|uniref:Oxidoreductase n=1 Tax=Peribacillus cavernae TaxID=1674310 RepID=A0A3S0U5P8_9BACI|nr:aldo/keto reductase [Peribacillus cavernae]MDQ0218582.1 putative oxidoreductase [Peribacillus cavernae]RUQ31570.1 oxidoreductase [Peribacillus cavernae]